MKINKAIILLLILWFLPNLYANSNESKNNKPDDRVLLKIPYEDRENLTKVMRANLENLGKMLNAMADDDFKSVQEVAEKMSFNKKKGEGLARRGNSTFTAIGVQFHAVDTINVMEAAKTNDRKATLHAMANMVNTCVSCHSGFKVMEWPNNKVYNRPEPTKLILPNGYKISN